MKYLEFTMIDADSQESTHGGWVLDAITGPDDALVEAYRDAVLGISDSRVTAIRLTATNNEPLPPDGETEFQDSVYEASDKILIEANTANGSPHQCEIPNPIASVMDGTDEVSAATIAGAIADLLDVWKSPAGEDLFFHAAHRIKTTRLT